MANDCSKLVNDQDCLERNLPPGEWCESCRIYEEQLRRTCFCHNQLFPTVRDKEKHEALQ
jgi:hypothetical protein